MRLVSEPVRKPGYVIRGSRSWWWRCEGRPVRRGLPAVTGASAGRAAAAARAGSGGTWSPSCPSPGTGPPATGAVVDPRHDDRLSVVRAVQPAAQFGRSGGGRREAEAGLLLRAGRHQGRTASGRSSGPPWAGKSTSTGASSRGSCSSAYRRTTGTGRSPPWPGAGRPRPRPSGTGRSRGQEEQGDAAQSEEGDALELLQGSSRSPPANAQQPVVTSTSLRPEIRRRPRTRHHGADRTSASGPRMPGAGCRPARAASRSYVGAGAVPTGVAAAGTRTGPPRPRRRRRLTPPPTSPTRRPRAPPAARAAVTSWAGEPCGSSPTQP